MLEWGKVGVSAWLLVCLVAWLLGSVVGCWVGWLGGWLVGWLVGCGVEVYKNVYCINGICLV